MNSPTAVPTHAYPLPDVVEVITRTFARMQSAALGAGEFADLSIRQITCLELIAQMEEPTATALARTLQVTKPTVSALLARLLQNGYVRKERSHADARSWHVHLTARGEAVMAAHRAVHERIAAQLVRGLDEAERAQLGVLLSKVVDSLADDAPMVGSLDRRLTTAG